MPVAYCLRSWDRLASRKCILQLLILVRCSAKTRRPRGAGNHRRSERGYCPRKGSHNQPYTNQSWNQCRTCKYFIALLQIFHYKIHGCRKWGFIIKKSQACEFIYSPVITKCPFIFIVADVEKNGGMVIESSNLRVHFSVHRIEEPLTGGVHTASKHQVLPNNQTQFVSNLKWDIIFILYSTW